MDRDISPFDVASLLLLLDVGRLGSITAAAAEWSMTTSAASQRIARLERVAGMPVVLRHARGVHLTDAGQALAGHAAIIRQELRAARGSIASLVTLEAGRLRLGSFPTVSASLASDALARFHACHPDVEVSVHSALRDELVDMLSTGLLDMTLLWTYPSDAGLPEEINATVLGNEPTVLLAPLEFDDSRPPHLGSLRECNWLARTEGHPATQVLHETCLAHGFEPRVVYQAHDYAEMQAMVAAGFGLGLVPRLALQHHRMDVKMVTLATASAIPRRAILLATHRRRADSPSMAALRSTFTELAGTLLE